MKPKDNDLEGLRSLATPEAAELLGVRPSVMESWRHTGAGPPFVRLNHKTVRYRIRDLAAWQESRVRKNTAA